MCKEYGIRIIANKRQKAKNRGQKKHFVEYNRCIQEKENETKKKYISSILPDQTSFKAAQNFSYQA